MIELRHDPDEEYDEDSILDEETEGPLKKEDVTLLSVFFTLHGAYILLSLGVFFGINYALENMDQPTRRRKVKSN